MGLVGTPNLNFSGHETFPFRQLWAYKASELLKTSNSPFTRDRDESMMNMGLGANMLKSMSFWIKSSGLVERDKNGDFSPKYTDKNQYHNL